MTLIILLLLLLSRLILFYFFDILHIKQNKLKNADLYLIGCVFLLKNTSVIIGMYRTIEITSKTT